MSHQISTQLSLNRSDPDSEYQNANNWGITGQEIRQFEQARNSFHSFLLSLGSEARIPLKKANFDFCKEIKQGCYDGETIMILVDRRVEKMVKNHRRKKNWCKEDCVILAWLLEKLTNGKHLKNPEKVDFRIWQSVANLIPGTNAQECMFKWLSMKKVRLCQKDWEYEESQLLEKLVKENGIDNWKKIARLLYFKNQSENKKYRSPKQCKQQWNCFLNPELRRGPWAIQQDLNLFLAVQKKGKKWSQISRNELLGRSQNAVKNRYSLIFDRKVKEIKNKLLPVNHFQEVIIQELRQSNQKQNKVKMEQQLVNNSSFNYFSNVTSKNTENNQGIKVDDNSQIKSSSQQIEPIQVIQCSFEELKSKFFSMPDSVLAVLKNRKQIFAFDGEKELDESLNGF